MAKTEKKINRKLRRRMRRTTAIVLLITSIIVAAIPVPENVAAPTGAGSGARVDALRYAYQTYTVDESQDITNNNIFPNTIDLDKGSGDFEHPSNDEYAAAMVVPTSSSSSPLYLNIFHCYDTGGSTVISAYDKSVTNVGTITIPDMLKQEYEVVEHALFDEFKKYRVDDFVVKLQAPTEVKSVTYYGDDGTGTWGVIQDDTSGSVPRLRNNKNGGFAETNSNISDTGLLNLVRKYFPDDLAAYTGRYQSFIADYRRDNPTATEAQADMAWKAQPDSAYIGEIRFNRLQSDDVIREFYCDMMMGSVEGITAQPLSGCILTQVTDVQNTNREMFIPCIKNESECSEYIKGDGSDDYGFVCGNRTNLIHGIGNKAFAGVGNVENLILNNNLQYIGNSAFEGSFIKSIQAEGLVKIGHRAFKGCRNLTEIQFQAEGYNTFTDIGVEAFYGTGLTEVTIPNSLQMMYKGAFANCPNLKTVTIDDTGTADGGLSIGDYAFYDCTALSDVKWTNTATSSVRSIGNAAFALNEGNGSLIEFSYPALASTVSTQGKLGQYMLAGHTELKSVYMPHSNWAVNSEFKLPKYTFVNCQGLECVDFTGNDKENPSYGRMVSFEEDMFLEVENPNFYIRGPQNALTANDPARPRQSTWQLTTAVSDAVPYIYWNTGKSVDYYEIDDKSYVYSINTGDGMLESCIMSPNNKTKGGVVRIPGKIGNTEVLGIGSDCFNQDETVKQNMTGLVIESGGKIASIADNAFEGCPKLTYIDLGDSVTKIGSNAFANCGEATAEIIDVYFRSPEANKDAYYASFELGDKAFAAGTGTRGIVFHGDVKKNFAPFTYAMTTPVNEGSGLDVCYKSLAPDNLTIIVDRTPDAAGNARRVPTLVDYPHYEDVDIDNPEAVERAKATFENQYAGTAYNEFRELYAKAKIDGNTDLMELYNGPWNNNQLGMTFTYNNVTYKTGSADILTEEDIKNGVQNIELGRYYDTHTYSIREAYENANSGNYDGPQPEEGDSPEVRRLKNALQSIATTSFTEGNNIIEKTMDLTVPEGVLSIDAYQFYTNRNNSANRMAYFLSPNDKVSKYTNAGGVDGETEGTIPGLFSGWFDEDLPEEQQQKKKGNDYIKKITLTDVEKLPDYAFDSCEGLEYVNLGNLKEVGNAPFRGCNGMEELIGSEDCPADNLILYSKHTDGSLILQECLPQKAGVISSETNPLLNEVSHIQESAFEDCNQITGVDLSDLTQLDTIPKYAFKNCKNLTDVLLPTSIKKIQEEAFTRPDYLIDGRPTMPLTVTVPGREVSIHDDAFDRDETLVKIRTYRDSAAASYAQDNGVGLEYLEDSYIVRFYDYDGTLLKEEYVEEGKDATPPEESPTRDGYKFTGWRGSYQQVYEDRIILAQYEPIGGANSGDPNDPNNPNNSNNPNDPNNPNNSNNSNDPNNSNGNNGSSSSDDDDDDDDDDDNIHTVTVINGMGSGRYKEGRTVTITANPAPDGQSFSYWTTESENVALASAQNSTTTFTMPDNRVTVTAHYKDGSSGNGTTYSTTAPTVDTNTGTGTGSGAGTGSGTGTGSDSGSDGTTVSETTPDTNTTVIVSKPGFSNTDLASATVNGSDDSFVVKITESAAAEEAVQTALLNEFGSLENIVYTAMDISLYDSTGTIQIADATGLTVDITLPIPDGQIGYGGNNKVAGVVDGTLDKLNARYNTIDGVDCITFTATHFSPYTIYVDTANLTAATDLSPKTGDPIHPKWFLALGLACISVILFMKKDEKPRAKAAV